MPPTIVETRYGKIRGSQENGLTVWRNIPFAKPPTDSLRFMPPLPPDTWAGIRDGQHFGPGGLQVAARPILSFASVQPDQQSEDCLTLNIWAKASSETTNRPVLVWIYGGSFVMGSGRLPVYDGASLALQGDIIVVTFNYRLGPFGFLYLDDLDPAYEGSGNVGLLDQIAALQWVHDNIEQFGGDPQRVCVAGESAGAISISNLLTMKNAQGLFQQAILQSGAGLMGSIPPDTSIATRFEFFRRLGVETPDGLGRLWEIPAHSLQAASWGLPWVPVTDGRTIEEPLWTALAQGHGARIPIMAGYNHHEYRYFMKPLWQHLDDQAMIDAYQSTLAGPIPPDMGPQYVSGKHGPELFEALAELGTDELFVAPTHQFASVMSRYAPCWVYRFDWESPVQQGALKACHAMEIPFVFNTLDVPGVSALTGTGDDRRLVARTLQQTWLAFIQQGNPNHPNIPEWPSYTPTSRSVLLLNSQVQRQDDPDAVVRERWSRFFA